MILINVTRNLRTLPSALNLSLKLKAVCNIWLQIISQVLIFCDYNLYIVFHPFSIVCKRCSVLKFMDNSYIVYESRQTINLNVFNK